MLRLVLALLACANIAYASSLTFCWDRNVVGNTSELFIVEVADNFGQVVMTATTVDTCFSFTYAGAVRVSVTGVDVDGVLGQHSAWSDLYLSSEYQVMLYLFSQKLQIPHLQVVGAWNQSMLASWRDPHENN